MLSNFINFKFDSYSNKVNKACQEESLNNLTPTEKLILNFILVLGNRHQYVFANQTTIGKAAGIGRRQSNTIIKKLCDLGLLDKLYRQNLTCLYRVSTLLLNPTIRHRYRHEFNAFRWLPLIWLFAGMFYSDCSRIINDNRIFINKYTIYPSTRLLQRRNEFMYGSEEQKALVHKITKKLSLSKQGQIKLMVYPTGALTYALGVLEAHDKAINSPIRNIIPWFLTICQEWCKSEEVEPNYKIIGELMHRFNLDPAGEDFITYSQERDKYHIVGYDQKPEKKPFVPFKKPINIPPFPVAAKEESPRSFKPRLNMQEAPDYSNYAVFTRAKMVAAWMPDHIKDELLQKMITNPERVNDRDINPAVVAALKEYESQKINLSRK